MDVTNSSTSPMGGVESPTADLNTTLINNVNKIQHLTSNIDLDNVLSNLTTALIPPVSSAQNNVLTLVGPTSVPTLVGPSSVPNLVGPLLNTLQISGLANKVKNNFTCSDGLPLSDCKSLPKQVTTAFACTEGSPKKDSRCSQYQVIKSFAYFDGMPNTFSISLLTNAVHKPLDDSTSLPAVERDSFTRPTVDLPRMPAGLSEKINKVKKPYSSFC